VLIIGPAEVAALSDQSERLFALNLATALQDSVGAFRGESTDDLVEQVQVQIARARTYGLESARAIAVYTLTAAHLGQDFDTQFPPANAVLASRDYSEVAKAEWLEAFVSRLFAVLD
jgi:hypothetical protein